jgi:hypothetical protein
MVTEATRAFDSAKAEAFGGQMISILKGGLLSMMVDIGHRTGLFAVASQGWMTSQQLAEQSGLHERYVREWLGAVTTGGILEYDETSETFCLVVACHTRHSRRSSPTSWTTWGAACSMPCWWIRICHWRQGSPKA